MQQKPTLFQVKMTGTSAMNINLIKMTCFIDLYIMLQLKPQHGQHTTYLALQYSATCHSEPIYFTSVLLLIAAPQPAELQHHSQLVSQALTRHLTAQPAGHYQYLLVAALQEPQHL